MSTLRTRIGGYLFVIKEGPNGRKFGMFLAENNGKRVTFMDLPYELRSTYSQESGQTVPILAAATDALMELFGRVAYEAEMHCNLRALCNCDNCEMHDAIGSRLYVAGRQELFKG